MHASKAPRVFVVVDCTSYTPAQLKDWFVSIRAECDEDVRLLRTPRGNSVPGYVVCRPSDWTNRGELSWEDYMVQALTAYPDHSMTGIDEPICPLSLDTFENPYYLVQARRSYELDFILTAIAKSYKVGEILRLESCVINPAFDNIRLVPHYGLGSRDDAEIEITPNDVVWPKFDPSASQYEHPQFTRLLAETPGLPDGNHFDGKTIWAGYCRYRGIPIDSEPNMTFANMTISSIELFKANHMKVGGGMIVFRNVHFVKCRFRIGCWCGTKFIGCKFTECVLESFGQAGHPTRVLTSIWENPYINDKVLEQFVTGILSINNNTLVGEVSSTADYRGPRRDPPRRVEPDSEDEDEDE